MSTKGIIKKILDKRGISSEEYDNFIFPDYDNQQDPFLLPDMNLAVNRLIQAHKKQEKITIYGDYDVDGVSATALLLDAFNKFGYNNVDYFLPDRFIDGYGMSERAIEEISKRGTSLIITVDCGSLNHSEILLAKSKGIDVIVTDHHNIADIQPEAVAVVNPRRSENKYANGEKFAGVGVAFKLVQALSTKLEGIPKGQEKWLLDLVTLGTICDVMELKGENRQNVFWGLKVLEKTRRAGLKALLVSNNIKNVSETAIGFIVGPRINAGGRLYSASIALDLVNEKNPFLALEKANNLNKVNTERKTKQDKSFQIADAIAQKYPTDNVIVIADESFHEGIVGIVASKILEKYKKPVFILATHKDIAKGSARSFGDFSVGEAIKMANSHIIKGGGHDAAAGVTLKKEKINDFRIAVNSYYKSLNLQNQEEYLIPKEDVILNDLSELNVDLYNEINKLRPFGKGNEEPILRINNLLVTDKQYMGKNKNHIKVTLSDGRKEFKVLKFNYGDEDDLAINDKVDILFNLGINEWQGHQTVEGMLVYAKKSTVL